MSVVSPGQEGLVPGENHSPGRDVIFVWGFAALVLRLEGNANLCVEIEWGCISFSTSPVKTCNTAICLSTWVLLHSFTDCWVSSGILGFLVVFWKGVQREDFAPSECCPLQPPGVPMAARRSPLPMVGTSTLGSSVRELLQQGNTGAYRKPCDSQRVTSLTCKQWGQRPVEFGSSQGGLNRNGCFVTCGT